MPYQVELTYFKHGGKYYSEGEYTSQKETLWEIFGEVREMVQARKLPGLVEGCSEFITLVNVPNHPHRHPHLVVPERFVDLANQIEEEELTESQKQLRARQVTHYEFAQESPV